MSILKYIMSPFVEFKDDETQPSKALKTEKIEKESKTPGMDDLNVSPSPVADTNSNSLVSSSQSSVSPFKPAAYQKHFEELIEDANARNPLFKGTDFKEFIDSKIDVESITDEETKYKTAFNVLKRTGLTKEKLVTTGQQYINLIDHDLKGFNEAYLQQFKTEVEQKEALLTKKTEELRLLNEKITALNNDMKKLSQEINESRGKLTSNKDAFISAGESKKAELKAELQKINQYFS
jgi:chromosome segregation ATPase